MNKRNEKDLNTRLITVITWSVLFFSVVVGVYIEINITTDLYLGNIYKKNWDSKFIVDLKVEKTSCPAGYNTTILGFWSGFNNGCFCKNNVTQQKIIHTTQCKDYHISRNMNCFDLNKTDTINIDKYKDHYICIKYSNASFTDIFDKLIPFYRSIEALISEKDIYDYKYNKFPNYIDENTIMDIKVLNTSIWSEKEVKDIYGFDLNEYEKIKVDSTYSFYVKRFKETGKTTNIFNYNKLISSINLVNYVWCAYWDLHYPGGTDSFNSVNNLNLGFNYCNKLNIKSSLESTSNYYNNDNGRLSKKINFFFDNTISKKDFYTKEIYDVYSEFGKRVDWGPFIPNDNSKRGEVEPALIYQNYFNFMGCNDLEVNSKEFITKLYPDELVTLFSLLYMMLKLCVVFFMIIYCVLICLEKKRLMLLFTGIFIGISVICLGLSIVMRIYNFRNYLYFINFQEKCEMYLDDTNYAASNSSPLLDEYINNLGGLSTAFIYSIGVESLNIVLLSILYHIRKGMIED